MCCGLRKGKMRARLHNLHKGKSLILINSHQHHSSTNDGISVILHMMFTVSEHHVL